MLDDDSILISLGSLPYFLPQQAAWAEAHPRSNAHRQSAAQDFRHQRRAESRDCSHPLGGALAHAPDGGLLDGQHGGDPHWFVTSVTGTPDYGPRGWANINFA